MTRTRYIRCWILTAAIVAFATALVRNGQIPFAAWIAYCCGLFVYKFNAVYRWEHAAIQAEPPSDSGDLLLEEFQELERAKPTVVDVVETVAADAFGDAELAKPRCDLYEIHRADGSITRLCEQHGERCTWHYKYHGRAFPWSDKRLQGDAEYEHSVQSYAQSLLARVERGDPELQ